MTPAAVYAWAALCIFVGSVTGLHTSGKDVHAPLALAIFAVAVAWPVSFPLVVAWLLWGQP